MTNSNTNFNKINVILDLDSTIIHSVEPTECLYLTPEFQNSFDHKDMIGYVRVFGRPHLQYFLDYLFDHFEVSVLTAADYGYGWFIVQNFILTNPNRKLKYFMHNYHTEMADEMYGKHKDLRMCFDIFQLKGMSSCNTVIIDDHPKVYSANGLNTIPAPAFLVMNEKTCKPNLDMINDTFLLETVEKLDKMKQQYTEFGTIH
jgi:TFIIF-interacting CTD phosphatase-like protein